MKKNRVHIYISSTISFASPLVHIYISSTISNGTIGVQDELIMQKKDTTVHNKASVTTGIIYCRKNSAQITIHTGRCPNLHTYRKMPNSFEIDFSTERF